MPTAGIWASLGGCSGSILGSPSPNSVTAVVASATTRTVAWIDTRSGVPAVYVATETGGVWSQLAGSAQGYGISGFVGAAAAPAIALLANGEPIVAWTQQTRTGTSIYVAEYNGTAWVALGNSLSAGGISGSYTASAPQILIVGGQPTVAWLDDSSGVANIYVAQWNGTAWAALGAGSTAGFGISGSQTQPITQFATATDGSRLAVAWTQSFASGPTQIYLTQYSGGAWSALAGSATGNGLSNAQYAASSATLAYFNGALFAAWQQYVANPDVTNPGIANPTTLLDSFEQAPVIYAAEYTGGAWQAAGAGALSGFGITASPDIATTPLLAANGGQLQLVWSDAYLDNGIDTHLYVKTWNGSAFAEALPGQASGEGVAQTSQGLDGLAFTLDPNGDPFLTWIDPGQTQTGLQVLGTPSLPAHVTVVPAGASLQTVLSGPNAGTGDVLYLTAGDYQGDVTIGPANAGVTIVGEPELGAVLFGALTITGSNVTLQGLTITGAVSASGNGFTLDGSVQTGGAVTLTGANAVVLANQLDAVSLQGATGLQLRGNTIAPAAAGIEIGAGSGGLIAYNSIVGAPIGIDIANAFSGSIADNLIENGGVGINYFAAAALIGNTVENNATGIVATVNSNVTGLGFVAGSGVNTIIGNALGVNLTGQMQDQLVTGNVTGISGSGIIGGASLALANDIADNTTGIGGFTGTVQFSRIERNGIGIEATSNLVVMHNLIYRNTTAGIDIDGVTDIRISDDTFYATTGDNIHVAGGSSNVEVLNSILWAETGYDIYVANDSQTGFFSDYNDLYAGATGKLVYWTRDFTDILDWQDDVALYDLHSVGRTAVNAADGLPHFVDLNSDNYTLLPLVAGQDVTDAAVQQGNPIVEYDSQATIPGIGPNDLINPGFENSLTGWTTNTGAAATAGTQSGYPTAYDGSAYFAPGSTSEGYVTQTVDLLTSGASATAINSATLDLVFGGRIRSGDGFPPDQGQITVTFYGAGGAGTTALGSSTALAPNVSDRWALVGGTVLIPANTVYVVYTFTGTRETGTSFDESFLDDAFVSTVTDGVATPAGAYETPGVADATSGTGRLALTAPELHVNWLNTAPHTITWDNFGNADAATQSVLIALYQQTATGPQFVQNITSAAGTTNTGSYTWIPNLPAGLLGSDDLFVQISLVSDPGVFARSIEPFTVVAQSSNFYVNDSSTAGDQYTTAAGSNRNDGVSPDQPLPDPDNVLRNYTLSAGTTIFVDPGTYDLIHPFDVSGSVNYSLGLDQGFTLQGPTGADAAILAPAIPNNPVNLIQLEDANLVTINNLTLTGAGRGVLVQNSTGFSATDLTITGMSEEGLRVDTGSTVTNLIGLTVSNSGLAGIYVNGTVTGGITGADVTNSGTTRNQYQAGNAGTADGLYVNGAIGAVSGIFSGNAGWGVYLYGPGGVHVTSSAIFDNGQGGLYITNSGSEAVIGDATLTDGDGDTVYSNGLYGIDADGAVNVAGNIVYGETGTYGIGLSSIATATENVVYGGKDGIDTSGPGAITDNRLYDNVVYGINITNGTNGDIAAITGNVIYSDAIGIYDYNYYNVSSPLIADNVLYANSTSAITIIGQSNVSIINNTIDQPVGDGIDLSNSNYNTHVRNNILVIGAGSGINVASNSENGFVSDYNLFDVSAGGAIGTWENVLRTTLPAWSTASFGDFDSITGDPLFVNPLGSAGALGYVSATQPGYDDDFHLQSKYGEFAGGSLAPVIVAGKPVFPTIALGTATLQSPGIDRGAASDSFANEPSPNGGYINLGAYGDTAQASESPSQYVLVLTPTAGATVQTGLTVKITWRAYGFPGTVDLSYSADGGATFVSIAAGLADNGAYTWTVPTGLAPGADYVLKVADSANAAVFGLSGVFTVSGKINKYYVNDASEVGDVYTTAVGDDGNDGLSAATPKATLQALLAAYTIGAGDTIYVDTGTYAVTTNIMLTSAESGASGSPLVITGPTSGTGAVLQRGNLNGGADVFSLTGASDITLQDLTIEGANFGVELTGASAGDTLLSDTIEDNSDAGVIVDVNNAGTATPAVSGLVIEADLIEGNGLDVPYGTGYGSNQSGVTVLQGNGAVQLLNDTVTGNNQYGVYLQDGYLGAGVSTIDGGAYYGQNGNYGNEGYGIYDGTGSLIENALVYGNHNDGIVEGNNGNYSATAPGRVTGNTVYGNGNNGINASGADVLDNLVYDQTNTSEDAISLGGSSTATGNTVYGSANGIFVGGGGLAQDNLVYDVSASGVYYTTSAPQAITANTVFGSNIGISGGEYYTGPIIPIEGNLLYDNITAGIALGGGLDQEIVNNTIDEPLGTGISITHNYSGSGASNTTVENNILVVGAGPAIYVEPDAETGFVSDYNLFDVTGSGAIGNWESLSYTSLANWFYELGFDQHSLTGDPQFVSAPATTPVVIDANTANPAFSLADPSVWTAVAGNAGVGGLSYQTTTFGPTAAASWTFTGLTVGSVYEISATWSANTDAGNADYVVTDGTSNVLASAKLEQYGSITSGITNSGSLYSLIGLFTATTTTAVVTLTKDNNDQNSLDVIADAVLLEPLGNAGANFHVQAGSPTIDAGDPTTPYLLEPGPNGGRVNLGYDGNTPQAQVSPSAQSIQVLSPAGLAKYQIGEQLPIDFQTEGLLTSQPILLLHTGGASIATGLQGNWSADVYGTGQSDYTDNATQIATIGTTVPSAPAALFDSGAYVSSASVGQKMSYTLPVGPGTYTLTLYFADPVVEHPGYREFNIIANGTTLESNFDVFATALATYGNGNDEISETFTVTVAPGAKSLELDFVNSGGYYGALVDGIQLDAPESGTASPTASVSVLTNGMSYTQLAAGIAINAYGQGQYIWTVNNDTSGANTRVKVVSGIATGTSQPFLIANGGSVFYVNDALQANDQYTAAAGNDANSGKSPGAPVASLSALFRAYPIGAGDTILVDNGSYLLPSDINLTAANSGTASHPLVIEGPTLPGTAAVIDRNNQASGADAFVLSGIDNIVISHLTLTGGYDGIEITAAASAVTLSSDVFSNNFNDGVDVPDAPYNGAYVSNIGVSNSEFLGNATPGYNSAGLFFGYYNSGLLLLNDQALNNDGFGVYLKGSNETIQGGAYGNSESDGITISNNQGGNALVSDVLVYGSGIANGNGADGIDIGSSETVTGSTVFGNHSSGISAGGGLISDNVVYDQSSIGIYSTGATVSGNTTFGDGSGIEAVYGVAEDNLSYDNSNAGIYQSGGSGVSIAGNTVYGNAVGISLTPQYTSSSDDPVTGNLIYGNITTGVALISSAGQQITNNTIYQPTGTGISLSGGDTASMIENNIIAVGAGAAISVASGSEIGLVSDYNMFDPTGAGAIGAWEAASYTALSAWYYATGMDQHSQVGDPGFVLPAGPDGILGFQTVSAAPEVVTNFTTTGVWTAYTSGAGGAGTTALQTAAGSGGTATWSLTGLTVNGVYQIAVNWPSNFLTGNALYTVKDANGHVLAVGGVNQYDNASTGITADAVGFSVIGQIVATTSTLTVTLTQGGNDVVIADAVLAQELGVNHGADDDFHVGTGSPTIDAGAPGTPWNLEPSPNGGRVNVGYDGDTAQAQVSAAAQILQVTGPAQFSKYEVGEQVPITIASTGISQIQPVVLIAAGQGAIDTVTQGQWQGDIDRLNGGTFQNYSTTVVPVAGIPAGLFTYGAYVTNSTAGSALNYFLPEATGTYTLRLYFADPSATAAGQRVFNVVVNGVTMQANYDVFSAAGGENKGVELDLTVSTEVLNGATGIALSFVNVSGYYGAFVNAIELDKTLAIGALAPIATIQVSTDSGATWASIASDVPINRFGYGQYDWTVDRTTTGSTALFRVISGAATATSQTVLLSNGGTLFYVNDGSTAGDQYTTAIGNNANSGKSPDQPMASLDALLRAYPIGPGDTVYVDTGNYTATSNAVLTAGDAGTAADPALITGPTNGGTVTINRNNPSGYNDEYGPVAGADPIDVLGASYITIANLSLTGGYDGVSIGGISNGITLQSDISYGATYYGFYVMSTGTVNGLTIENSTARANPYGGIYLNSGSQSALLLNDQVFNNTGDGIAVYSYGSAATIQGGAVYANTGDGIGISYQGDVSDVLVHGNGKNGLNVSSFSYASTITGNTVYANAQDGIYASGADVSDNLIYDQSSTTQDQVDVENNSTATGNTIYGGGTTGLFLGANAQAFDNVVYSNAGDGIHLYNNGAVATGNIVYGNAVGIQLDASHLIVTSNLVYNNVSTGLQVTSGNTNVIVNNTVYQSVGQALTLANTSTVTVENNILWVDQGTVISVDASSATGFLSNYNLFYQGADATPATLGMYQGAAEATLAAWQTASGQDANSETGNPDFVNMTGADKIQGGIINPPGTPVGAGYDDDFELSAHSPAIDSANADTAPATDLLGQPRVDDPATGNAGIGNSFVTTKSGGASTLPSGGTRLNDNSYGGTYPYTFTQGFSFTLFGNTYTSVGVSSDGYLQFGGATYTTGSLSGTMANFVSTIAIAPFWGGINTYYNSGSGDDVYVIAGATSVTFRWQASTTNGETPANFSVTLNSDGSVVFNYGSGNVGANPIVGISAGNGYTFLLSSLSGSGNLANAPQQVFTPVQGVDIGAIEFQGSSSDTSLLKVTSITLPPTDAALPTGNAATALAFNSIVLTFSEPLDYVSANSPKNYSLIEADSGGSFTAADATIIPVTPQFTLGSNMVTLLLPSGVPANGKYQLTLSGTLAIFDESANKLAGNGTTAGTDEVVLFQINRSADQPPAATAQSVATNEDSAVRIVLAATDAGGLPLTYSIVVPPGDGAVSAITNGNTLTYTPTAGFFGADAFTFQATDPDGAESRAIVSLTVNAVNQAPVATEQSVTLYHNQAQVIVLGGSDAETLGSQLTYTITTPPAHGTLTPVSGSPGAFTYTPTSAGYIGADSFAFTVTDTGSPAGTLTNAKTSAPATVSVTLADPAPVGVPVTYTTRTRVPLNVPAALGVLSKDVDAAGDTLTATLDTTTAHGTLLLHADGSFFYTPATGFSGTDSFTYTPVGALTSGAPVTVTINVTPNVAAPSTPPSLPRPHAMTAIAASAGRHAPAQHADAKHADAKHADAKHGGAARGHTGHGPKHAAADSAALLAVANPILLPPILLPPPVAPASMLPVFMLPVFTQLGDEVATLMLPAAPEMAHLHEAVGRATKRLTERTPSDITYVDPVTGQADGEHAAQPHREGHRPWLLVDTNVAARPSRIMWENAQA